MTLNYNTIIQSINLYNSLKKRNIIGIERKNIILVSFAFSMSTFYIVEINKTPFLFISTIYNGTIPTFKHI
jgi:hypothetical protein